MKQAISEVFNLTMARLMLYLCLKPFTGLYQLLSFIVLHSMVY